MNKGVIIGIIVMIIVGVFGTFFFFGTEGDSNLIKNSKISEITSSSTPKEVYLAYHNEFDNMNNFNDFVVLVNKYGAEEIRNQLSRFDQYTPEQRDQAFSVLKESTPKTSEFKDIQENIAGEMATLVILTEGTTKGDIEFRNENGLWRLTKDDWTRTEIRYTNNSTIK